MIKILTGDCRTYLAAIKDNSINCVVTSPPYWGLRDYGGEPQVWGGQLDCAHDFVEQRWYTESSAAKSNGSAEAFHEAGSENAERLKAARWRTAATCSACGAWRGAFGLEPTYQMYVEHSVEIFREVKRVLKPDGTFWLNLGDSYSGSGRGGNPEAGTKQGTNKGSQTIGVLYGREQVDAEQERSRIKSQQALLRESGIKHKDLIGIPWRVAFALQADGWYLRQDNIWSKPNPMPESVTDRTTRAHEYMFHFSKSVRYYYDNEAIKEPPKASSIKRVSQKTFDQQTGGKKDYGPDSNRSMRKTVENFKNAVFGGTNKASGYGTRKHSGNEDSGSYLVKGVNKRSVWHIAPKPFKEAHFATFPPELITPCILAGCPPNGIVLDPFAGSGTVGAVCNVLGRHAILIEQNPKYVEMIERRCGLAPAQQAAE